MASFLWLSPWLWKQPRTSSGFSLSAFLPSSKPEKTYDRWAQAFLLFCSRPMSSSIFQLFCSYLLVKTTREKPNVDEEHHLYFIDHKRRSYSAFCYITSALSSFMRRIFLVGWCAMYFWLLSCLQSSTCICLVQWLAIIKGPSHGLSSLWRPSVFCILRSTKSPIWSDRDQVLLL